MRARPQLDDPALGERVERAQDLIVGLAAVIDDVADPRGFARSARAPPASADAGRAAARCGRSSSGSGIRSGGSFGARRCHSSSWRVPSASSARVGSLISTGPSTGPGSKRKLPSVRSSRRKSAFSPRTGPISAAWISPSRRSGPRRRPARRHRVRRRPRAAPSPGARGGAGAARRGGCRRDSPRARSRRGHRGRAARSAPGVRGCRATAATTSSSEAFASSHSSAIPADGARRPSRPSTRSARPACADSRAGSPPAWPHRRGADPRGPRSSRGGSESAISRADTPFTAVRQRVARRRAAPGRSARPGPRPRLRSRSGRSPCSAAPP